jgi:hypothetical protein
MRDKQDGQQAIDRISKSRESCHPVKRPKRALSDMCGNETIKRYRLSIYPTFSQAKNPGRLKPEPLPFQSARPRWDTAGVRKDNKRFLSARIYPYSSPRGEIPAK